SSRRRDTIFSRDWSSDVCSSDLTAFALNLVRNAALHPSKPTPVAFFSLEMSAGQLVQRILSAESEIMLEKISRGKLEEHEMKQQIGRASCRERAHTGDAMSRLIE